MRPFVTGWVIVALTPALGFTQPLAKFPAAKHAGAELKYVSGVPVLTVSGGVPTWAAASGGGGYTQIATTTVSVAVANVTFSSIPTSYGDLYVVIEGISHDNGSSTTIGLYLSANNGSSYTGNPIVTTGSSGNTFTWYGGIQIPGYLKNAGVITSGLTFLSALDGGAASASSPVSSWRVSGGLNNIRFLAAAGNIDAGTITLFGR